MSSTTCIFTPARFTSPRFTPPRFTSPRFTPSKFLATSVALLLLTPAAFGQLVINEVLVDPKGPNKSQQIVEIVNNTNKPFTPTGWFACVPFAYAQLPATSMPAGSIVRLHINASGTDTATDWFLPGLRDLAAADTFLIYKSGNFNVDADIVDFVSWGGGNARIQQAVNVGQWASTTSTVPLPKAEGETIAWRGGGDSAADWYRDASPTLGRFNNGGFTIATLGGGCRTSRGMPVVEHPLPPVDGNRDYVWRLRGAAPGAPILVLGGTRQLRPPTRVLGCDIGVSENLFTLLVTSNQQGTFDLPLPVVVPGVSLKGVTLFLQTAVGDSASPNGAFGMSSAIRLTIGG